MIFLKINQKLPDLIKILSVQNKIISYFTLVCHFSLIYSVNEQFISNLNNEKSHQKHWWR